ncbi:MAG: tryptophan--tRNA ligase [Firmicutes bacterium]|nr:tryptophan--tRNA ligase [Bacillota bacterium]
MVVKKNVILTGVKPSGTLHLGNYLGAIAPAIKSANESTDKSYFFIADAHALTTVKNAKELSTAIRHIACVWLACGLDVKKTAFYRQSDIPEIFELATIISNVTPKGLLNRAHAYKTVVQNAVDKNQDPDKDVNVGLFTYPVLQAADIMIVDTSIVPVGQDQKQHIEIAADIAKSFNAVYGNTLVVPKDLIKPDVGTIAGLDGRKMSKSYGNVIPLFCSEQDLLKAIKRIETDSSLPTDPKPKDHLIYVLYKHFTGKDLDPCIGWGDAKQRLFDAVNKVITPMRERYNYLMENYGEVEKILALGAVETRKVARETLNRVRKAVGIS